MTPTDNMTPAQEAAFAEINDNYIAEDGVWGWDG